MSATLKIGYYQCFFKHINIAQHTYAFASENGTDQWYDCWGGHEPKKGEKGVWPAKFWHKEKYLKRLENTGKTSVPVNQNWADGIASWGSRKPKEIQESRAGIIYALTGVCHNSCNRVLYAATQGPWGYINYPPSARISWELYGYYGGGPKGIFDRRVFRKLDKFKGMQYANEGEGMPSIAEGLELHLAQDFSEDQILEVSAIQYGMDDDDDARLKEIVRQQMPLIRQKRDFDRDMLAGNFGAKDEAVATVNGIAKGLIKVLENHLEEQEFGAYTAEAGAEEQPAGEMATSELMPDLGYYQELGKLVKL